MNIEKVELREVPANFKLVASELTAYPGDRSTFSVIKLKASRDANDNVLIEVVDKHSK